MPVRTVVHARFDFQRRAFMIGELRVQNVRLFGGEDPQAFPLAPLTVLTGTNSSGKSTVLKILPLLRQTQGIGEAAITEDGKLRLKGTQVDLGTFQSFVTDNDTDRTIGIGLTYPASTTKAFVRWLEAIESGNADQFKVTSGDQEPTPYNIKCWFEFVADPSAQSGRRISGGTLSKATFETIINGRNMLSWRLTSVRQQEGGHLIRLSFPKPFWEASGIGRFLRPLEGSETTEVDHITALRGILPSIILAQVLPQQTAATVIQRAGKEDEAEEQWSRWPLPSLTEDAVNALKTVLERVHYVGPLRSQGKRFYLAEDDVSPGLDPAGAFLPYVLRDKGDEKVMNAHLVSTDYEPIEETLTDALNYWLAYLRTCDPVIAQKEQMEFDLASTDKLVELKLQSPSSTQKFSLEDSGFGYSQLLPVLTRGLLAEVGGTLVVEQPEVHLHPALQVRLANFFIAMARCGKQVVLETHSEHLINAIRVLVAEAADKSFAQLCKVYFLEVKDVGPAVHELAVKPDGTFEDIPKTFFGEALELSGRLLRAQKHH